MYILEKRNSILFLDIQIFVFKLPAPKSLGNEFLLVADMVTFPHYPIGLHHSKVKKCKLASSDLQVYVTYKNMVITFSNCQEGFSLISPELQ